MVVGWYHSHPGFGCWLSGVDINTQQSFEALNQRAVAVVVDPIQSVKGKVVIDAFRLINPQTMMLGQEPRQTTSNLGHLNKPSIQALIHGLNRHYYSIAINYRKNELEEKMLLNLHKKKWTDGLTLQHFDTHSKTNEQTVQQIAIKLSYFRTLFLVLYSSIEPVYLRLNKGLPTMVGWKHLKLLSGNPPKFAGALRTLTIDTSRVALTYCLAFIAGPFLLQCANFSYSSLQEMLSLAIKYNKAVQEEDELPPEKLAIANVGRQDAKKHLEEHVSNLMSSNIVQTLGMMLDTVVF
ncbi:hypothetical protein ACSQ67_012895 [Phaseolus vulgaris]